MFLVGVVRYDLDGTGRLERLLEQRKPKIITLDYPAIYSLKKLAGQIGVFRSRLVSSARELKVPENVRGFLETMC